MPSKQLTDLEHDLLQFEQQWWKYAGAKEAEIRTRFDLTSTRYYQRLNALIDEPAAYATYPLLVKRLRSLRETRRQARAATRLHRLP